MNAVDEFECFIKPVRNKKLTDFCSELTSITQSQVDEANEYPQAIKAFQNWLYQYSGYVFCSLEDYDKKQLIQDSQYHRIGYPIDAEHINIKKLFSINQGLKNNLEWLVH
ncbi:exonuclease domain-containing protein [Aliikangiella sp. IMCC44359]|uniref:exonuclease domain-containing protein n=1 Tax=Aliikangiella sp. IMCC44359 TaxID=3459125 RepID=UPI00403AF39C